MKRAFKVFPQGFNLKSQVFIEWVQLWRYG